MKLGVEIYSVWEAYKSDLIGTLKKLKGMGYDAIELFGPINYYDVMYLKGVLDTVGLEPLSSHIVWAEFETPEKVDAVIEYVKKIGCPCVVVPWMPEMTVEQWEEIIQKFNVLNEKFQSEGLGFGFHAHKGEMLILSNGKCAWEMIGDGTPDNFIMQIDVGNAMNGGQDPYNIYTKYAHKGRNVHYKAYSAEKQYDCAIGEDDIDWKKIVAISKASNCELIIVEKDLQDNFVSVEKSAKHLIPLL